MSGLVLARAPANDCCLLCRLRPRREQGMPLLCADPCQCLEVTCQHRISREPNSCAAHIGMAVVLHLYIVLKGTQLYCSMSIPASLWPKALRRISPIATRNFRNVCHFRYVLVPQPDGACCCAVLACLSASLSFARHTSSSDNVVSFSPDLLLLYAI